MPNQTPEAAPSGPAPARGPKAASPWRQALDAGRANLWPGLALQVFALALVLAYYFHGPTHAFMDRLADLKARWGFLYSLVATAIFGGILPFLYLRAMPATRAATPWSHGLFLTVFWAYKGIEVDLFYRLQGWMFGNEPGLASVVPKVLVDQIVYVPFWATPVALVLFHWKEHGFGLGHLHVTGWPGYWRTGMPKALIGTWGVWLPAVAIIYSLPATLQIPLFNVVLLFYSLLFASLTRK